MELFELKEEIEITKTNIKSSNRKIQRLREELEPKAMDTSKERVDGSRTGKTIEDIMHQIIEMEKKVQRSKNLLDDYYQEVREKEAIYQQYKDRDKQLYIDKKLYKLNNTQLDLKYPDIGKRRRNEICRKMEEKMRKNKKSSP